MIAVFLVLISAMSIASAPMHWSSLLEVKERHEFYLDNENIDRPKGVWQTLFAVVYPDRNLWLHKDCVYFKVPNSDDGIFKIRSTGVEESCDLHIEETGEVEIQGLRSLQFAFSDQISVYFTFKDFRTFKWSIPILNKSKANAPKLLTSSAEVRSPRLVLLAPAKLLSGKSVSKGPKNGEICHSVADDCTVVSPSICHQCSSGWYEIPNGCAQGPKYCGVQICGTKGQPACRRGMKYQKVRKKFECSSDPSFAYCAPETKLECEGGRAYCR
jgi:hypothetical protein